MPKSYLIDMDGVIVRGNQIVPGADSFIARLHERGIKFLILTNNPMYTPFDLQHRLQRLGLNISPDHIYTSAQATAAFLKSQKPRGTAYTIGESGLTEALHEVGYILTEHQPDYMVLGETNSFSFAQVTRAVRLVDQGARFIATNPDPVGPGEGGLVPACGAVAAMIQAATGVEPYFVGKPNPLMLRTALRAIEEHSENAIMVGDRMDTDIRVGTEAGMETILVLSGVTRRETVARYPYQPTRIVESVAQLEMTEGEPA
ncbi:MAG: HAD-IIA family hydrolase [Rudaea sp.]